MLLILHGRRFQINATEWDSVDSGMSRRDLNIFGTKEAYGYNG
jgi:hypothetical protein